MTIEPVRHTYWNWSCHAGESHGPSSTVGMVVISANTYLITFAPGPPGPLKSPAKS